MSRGRRDPPDGDAGFQRWVDRQLHALFDPVLDEGVPPRLQAAIEAAAAAEPAGSTPGGPAGYARARVSGEERGAMRLEGKTAVITGGASGIGRAIARRFAEEGAAVVIGDVTTEVKEGGAPTHEVIAEAGGTALFQPCDVSRWADVDALVGLAVERFGGLDVMVNNAAIHGAGTKLLETSEEDWDRVMAVNAKGVFFGCKRAVQQMRTQPVRGDARGRIVNISSQHGMVCAPGKIAYGTGKAAAVYLTRQVAVDYAEDHIICNAVAPGRILTGKPLGGAGSDPLEYSRARTPMPRLGEARDVANAALFLASDEAGYVTGHNLMVDGGWMAY